MKLPWLYAIALIACALAMFPPIWALYVSLSVTADGRTELGFGHYFEVMGEPQFWLSLWNSFAAAESQHVFFDLSRGVCRPMA